MVLCKCINIGSPNMKLPHLFEIYFYENKPVSINETINIKY